MKIGKAIKTVRKLAKTAFRETSSMSAPAWARAQKTALKSVKALLEAFDEDLAARSELTSLRHAASAIARRMGEVPLDPARALEDVAELAMSRVARRTRPAKRDEVSAVSIVRALAADIRAVRTAPRARRANADAPHSGLQLA